MAIDPRFFSVIPSTAASLAQRAGCELRGDGERMVAGAAPVSVAGAGDLTFLADERGVDDVAHLAGAVVVTTADLGASLPAGCVCLVSESRVRLMHAAYMCDPDIAAYMHGGVDAC